MLCDYLPSFYHDSNEVVNLQSAIDFENNLLKSAVSDLQSQLFIQTATWGLPNWEKMLGVSTDLALDFSTRRNVLKAKLRGLGVTTNEQLQNVCLSYTNGEVEIIENFADYSFIIKFVSILGIPQNIETLRQVLSEIVPCHLGFSFEFKYNTWGAILGDWDDYSSMSWDDLTVFSG